MDKYPVSPIQRYCLLVSEREGYGADMNVGACFYFPIDRDVDFILSKIEICVLASYSLNTHFYKNSSGDIFQSYVPEVGFVEYIDTSINIDSDSIEESLLNHYREWYKERNVSDSHAKWVSGIVSRNKKIEYKIYSEIPRRITLIGSKYDGYTICMSFHHAMCDANSISIIHENLKQLLYDKGEVVGDHQIFIKKCINEYERFDKQGENQLNYWNSILKNNKFTGKLSLLDQKTELKKSVLLHSIEKCKIFSEGRVSHFYHLCALFSALRSIDIFEFDNIISTIDNRRSIDHRKLIGCQFRHIIWNFSELLHCDYDKILKYISVQSMRHYNNLDVTLDCILNNYKKEYFCYPLIEIGFSFRIVLDECNNVKRHRSEIVPQYIDAFYDRLKFHLHVQVDENYVSSFATYDDEYAEPQKIESLRASFAENLMSYVNLK